MDKEIFKIGDDVEVGVMGTIYRIELHSDGVVRYDIKCKQGTCININESNLFPLVKPEENA